MYKWYDSEKQTLQALNDELMNSETQKLLAATSLSRKLKEKNWRDEAKKKLEKLKKSKECKVKKEKMVEEKARLESLLSESKKKLEAL